MTRNADFKRRVRERMARTGESYAAARAQLLPRTTLHVTNGDSTVEKLGLDALPWRDALHEGPVVKDGRARRAEFLGVDEAEFERRDRRLDEHEGDYVLWFEADLYDQLQIVEILWRLRAQAGPHPPAPGRRARRHPALRRARRARPGAAARAARGRAHRRLDRARRARVGRAHRARAARPARGRQHARAALHGRGVQAPRAGVPVAPRRPLALRAAPARRARPARSTSCSSAPGARRRARSWATRSRSRRSTAWRRCSTTTTASCASTTAASACSPASEQFVTERWIGGVHVTPETPWRWDDAREGITYRTSD